MICYRSYDNLLKLNRFKTSIKNVSLKVYLMYNSMFIVKQYMLKVQKYKSVTTCFQ